MTDDLIARLLDLAHCNHDDVSVAAEAADEIERLRFENDRLRALLFLNSGQSVKDEE